MLNWIKPPKNLINDDKIAVFLKNKSKDFSPSKKIVKAGAFMPDNQKGRFETSAFKINDLKESAIWKLGHFWTVVNPWPRKSGTSSVKARADLSISQVMEAKNLLVELSPSPHPAHVNIINWENEESAQHLQALQLVLSAKFVPFEKKK